MDAHIIKKFNKLAEKTVNSIYSDISEHILNKHPDVLAVIFYIDHSHNINYPLVIFGDIKHQYNQKLFDTNFLLNSTDFPLNEEFVTKIIELDIDLFSKKDDPLYQDLYLGTYLLWKIPDYITYSLLGGSGTIYSATRMGIMQGDI